MILMLYALLIIGILFFLGFGFAYLLIPEDLKKYSFWLIPWFGIIASIVLLVILSFLGIPVKISAFLLLSLSLIVNIFILIKKRQLISLSDFKENLLIFLLIIGSIFFLLYPLIKVNNFPTTVSFGNNDIISYIAGSDYLIDNSVQKAIYDNNSGSANDILLGPYRFGPTALYSFFSYIFGLKPYQITYILQAAIFPLLAPLIYILIKILYKKTYIGLLLSFFITVFNVNLLYMFYHNFFPHTIFRGLTCFLLIFFLSYLHLKNKKEKTSMNRLDFIISIGLAATFFSYHEAVLIFLIIPLGFYAIVVSLLNKNIEYLNKLLKIGFITVIIGLPSVIYGFRFLLYYLIPSTLNKDIFIGWQLFRNKIPYANPFEALGFYSIHLLPPMPDLLAILLSAFILVIIILGLFRSKFKIFLSLFLFYYILIFVKSWIIIPNFFDYARALSYTLPIFIITFSIGFSSLFEKHKLIGIIILIIPIGLELFSAVKLNTRFTFEIFEKYSVDKGYISLKDIQNKTAIIKKPIFIENQLNEKIPLWNRIWTSYFLNLNSPKIVIAKDIKPQDISDGNLVLISKIHRKFELPRFLTYDNIWENQYYKIGYLCRTENCLLKQKKELSAIRIGNNDFEDSLLLSGWYSTEGEARWADEQESTLRLVTKNNYPSNLVIEALSINIPQEMTVYINGELIGKISVGTEWKSYSIPVGYPLNPGVQKIEFVYSNGYRPIDIIPGNLDSRTLYVSFKKIALE